MSEVIEFLETRRSVLARDMVGPGPDEATLARMLNVAMRVPDHGKLAPWRFIVVQGEDRVKLADAMIALGEKVHGAMEPQVAANDRARFEKPAMTVIVVSTPMAHPKVPASEQEQSAAAVCLNLLHGAHALGFVAQWLTGWQAFDDASKRLLGVGRDESIAGFISIGSTDNPPQDRPRPELGPKLTRWTPPAS